MELENIVLLNRNGRDITVLDSSGNQQSEFQAPSHVYDLFQVGEKIIANLIPGLICYNPKGEICWINSDCHTDTKTKITYGNYGFYVLSNEFKVSEKRDGIEVPGGSLSFVEPSQQELWLGNIDFNGKTRWYRQVQEHTAYLSSPLISHKLVVPYKGPKEKKGFMVLDSNGNPIKDISEPNMDTFPMALSRDHFIHQTTDERGKKLKGFNVSMLSPTFSKSVNHSSITGFSEANQNNCCLLNNKLYMRSPFFIRELNLDTYEMKEHNILNYNFTVMNNSLVVDHASEEYRNANLSNKIGLGKVTAFDSEMKKQWSYDLPEWCRDKNYGFFNHSNQGILISDWDRLFKINKDGKKGFEINIRPFPISIAKKITND